MDSLRHLVRIKIWYQTCGQISFAVWYSMRIAVLCFHDCSILHQTCMTIVHPPRWWYYSGDTFQPWNWLQWSFSARLVLVWFYPLCTDMYSWVFSWLSHVSMGSTYSCIHIFATFCNSEVSNKYQGEPLVILTQDSQSSSAVSIYGHKLLNSHRVLITQLYWTRFSFVFYFLSHYHEPFAYTKSG
jgi:hypothetical protein